MTVIDKCFKEWLRYQSLWDLQPEMLYGNLGIDMSKWIRTLVEIKYVHLPRQQSHDY